VEGNMSSEKKAILFLGSGASVPFGLPTTKQLHERLKGKYRPETSHTFEAFISSFLELDVFQDIEDVLQCLIDLQSFAKTRGGWYLFDKEKGKGKYSVYEYQENLMDVLSNSIKVRQILEDEIFNQFSRDNLRVDNIQTIYSSIFDTIKKYSSLVKVFTTNYDVAVEEYLERNDILYEDGFRLNQYKKRYLWDPTVFDESTAASNTQAVHLFKLHGSLNWKEHRIHGIEKATTQRKIFEPDYLRDIVIFPTISPKIGSDVEPYRTLRGNFVDSMKTSDACISIGFSFRESHLNEIFKEFLDRKKLLLVISPTAAIDVYGNLLKEEVPEKILSNIRAREQFSEVVQDPHIGFIHKELWKENVKAIMKEVIRMIDVR
jgi:hypothetical protein